MAKQTLQISISSKESFTSYKVIALRTSQSIIYYEPDNTKVIFNFKENSLLRENIDFKMLLDFTKEESYILLKEINKKVFLKLKKVNVKLTKQKINIHYELNNINYKYKIEVLK